MSAKAQVKSAENRAAYHLGRIAAEVSPRAKARMAAEWQMAETRRLEGDALDAAVVEMTRVAREMNERSRP